MAPTAMQRVADLAVYRRARGLTQNDLALLLDVTQQAIAKWELGSAVPARRVKDVARHLRVSVAALLPGDAGSAEARQVNLRAKMREFFAEQVVVCFDDLCLHYCPSAHELSAFWKDLQRGGLVHLSAGPVQVLINVGAARRVDISEDPPLSSYVPTPIGPTSTTESDCDAEPDADDSDFWFDRNEARVFVRGTRDPYSGPQGAFDVVLDGSHPTREELATLYEELEGDEANSNSIFALFDFLTFNLESDYSYAERGDPLHADSLHVFASEDYDAVPQRTWIHTRDIRAIEIPTRLWEVYQLSAQAALNEPKALKRRSSKAKKSGGQ